MTSRRSWGLMAVPVAGLCLIGVGLLIHRGADLPGTRTARRAAEPSPSGESRTMATPYVAARPEPVPKLAPEEDVAHAAYEARVKSTYQNYRTAVATGNEPLIMSLFPVLQRDRPIAARFAQEDLARARTEFDRDLAQKLADSLRR